MLIRITNRCTMGCSHCMTEASPDGEHMSLGTFQFAVAFAMTQIEAVHLLISGGEPTDHPKIIELLKEVARFKAGDRLPCITLLTNGLFLHGDPKRRDQILKLVDCVQVTNDDRFYPRKVQTYCHPKVLFERRIRKVYPAGRALSNKLPADPMHPSCFNVRSATRTFGSMRLGVQSLWGLGKFCAPSINPDGAIVAGELSSCRSIGRVDTPIEILTMNLLTMRCNRCGGYENLDDRLRKAVGEDVSIAPGSPAW